MKNSIILVTENGLGKGSVELQQLLATKYFSLLLQNNELPSAICFYTDGVKLTVTGSPVLEQLKALEGKGVRIIACSTCLDHYKLTDSLQVGVAGSMADIIEAQTKAGKVITI
ncbi:MAG: DsrE family protein [Anaerolineales bacterium]|nr:DsrE family protein [Anaerolineales bacterium]MBP6211155.1 DsrE family protein [Anaerolineales bacterium]